MTGAATAGITKVKRGRTHIALPLHGATSCSMLRARNMHMRHPKNRVVSHLVPFHHIVKHLKFKPKSVRWRQCRAQISVTRN